MAFDVQIQNHFENHSVVDFTGKILMLLTIIILIIISIIIVNIRTYIHTNIHTDRPTDLHHICIHSNNTYIETERQTDFFFFNLILARGQAFGDEVINSRELSMGMK